MIHRWISALTRTLGRLRVALRRFAGVAPDGSPEARVYWNEGVTLTLTDLVQEAETRASGRVQVISLVDFRAAVGELWERYEARILLIAESTISRMIGRGNTFIPQDKDTWLLLFPALSEPEALKRADAIAARIGEKLVGARFTEIPPPLPEAAKLDLSGVLNADGSLNLERVKAAVLTARQGSTIVAPAKAATKLSSVNVRPSVAPSPPQAKSEASQLTVSFRPAWNAETQSVDSFFFRASRSDGSEVIGASAAAPNDATALDLLALAGRAFSDMRDRGLRAILTVPIPFATLQGPQLPEIQRLIASLPQRDRLIHLRIEVTHVPLRVGAESLVPVRELFRSHVRDVAFLLDLFQPSDQALALDHIMLGVELPRGQRNDDEVFQALLSFRQRTARRKTYVLGLSSRLQVAHALTAGMSEIGGAGILGDMKKLPDQVTVIRRQDLVL
jgi:hypothetical protein